MILVRLVFQAKFGKAADLVAVFKEFSRVAGGSGGSKARHVRILTDLSGPFDTVIQELEFESFEAWQQDQAALFANPQVREAMARTRDLIAGGYKEFYTLETEQ